MFIKFFYELKSAGLPVSVKEYLMFLEVMDADLADKKIENFYYLARASLVKDERNLDKFDRVFGHVFKGLESVNEGLETDIPEDWLRKLTEKFLTDEEKAQIEALGGWDKLMETLKKRLEEQEKRHQGGNKWIGTAGTSPFGAYGYNPEGIRIGQNESRHKRAVKVWDKREFKDLDDSLELGTRNLKMALRKLRQFARAGAEEEFDLKNTIDATARSGYLDIKMRPERRNVVKVLIFFDVGGSMDPYVKLVEELFSAARAEFKHMEYFYFHNCLYDYVWKDNSRRWTERLNTWDILHTYPHDYKVIVVGDAAMSPYEIAMVGGASEYMNEEAGAVWLQRLADVYSKLAWINPEPERYWQHTQSNHMIRQIIGERMYPLTVDGIGKAIKNLSGSR